MNENIRRIITLIAAAVTLTIAIVGGAVSHAEAAPGWDCRKAGWTNMYTTAGDEVTLDEVLAAGDNKFNLRRCTVRGMRVEKSYANTQEEIRELRQFVNESTTGRRHGMPLVFCRTSFVTGYMMGPVWLWKNIRLNSAEKNNWSSFARNWVRTHDGCRLSR